MDIFAPTTPSIITAHILSFVEGIDLLRIYLVSKHWHSSCTDIQTEKKWEELGKNELGIKFKPSTWTWKTAYIKSYKEKSETKVTCQHLITVNVDFLKKKKETIPNKCQVEQCPPSPYNDPWLCATNGCDYVGCSRDVNAHAFNHFQATKHPVVQRLSLMVSSEKWGFPYDHPFCYMCDSFSDNKSAVTKQLIQEMREALHKENN